ncbi:MAG: hypothetical protein JST00_20050 [Deltaproteobacteria bacterium]|nr:hypothetical protein [Deltaproteobacteria bacterium]
MPKAAHHPLAPSAPSPDAATVVPSDSTVLDPPTRGLFVGGAGNVSIETFAGSTVTFTGVLAGQILPVVARKVRSSGTTATNIVALF